MNLQNKILQDYRAVFGHQTFREMAAMTGIQQTRAFRIFNGSPMKLCEYEVLQQMIQFRQAKRPALFQLLKDCELRLGQSGLNEIEQLMEQKMRLWKLTHAVHSMDLKQAA